MNSYLIFSIYDGEHQRSHINYSLNFQNLWICSIKSGGYSWFFDGYEWFTS